MSGGHAHGLYLHGRGSLYDLPAQCKIVAALVFVFAVVATPRESVWVFAVLTVMLLAMARSGGIVISAIVRRLWIEIPLVLGAVMVPFVAGGEQVDVLFFSVSREGAWAAWNMIAKATLGLAATATILASTEPSEMVRGLRRLRVPRVLVEMAGFMVRYMDVISGEMHRMRIARESRASNPRWLWQVRAQASTAGYLFIRSYERGERVLQAMSSRCYSGEMPALRAQGATKVEWLVAMLVPALAGCLVLAAVVSS